jgi:hypothetical protein
MRAFPLLFGAVRHCKLIGQDESHKALRARNEARLAALKSANRLYEVKREPTAAERAYIAGFRNTTYAERAAAGWYDLQCTGSNAEQQRACYNAGNGYEAGSALATIFGTTRDDWFGQR